MKRLGEILVENGFISLDALNEAIQEQQSSDGKKLGEILVENGHLSQDTLLKSYAIQAVARPISENELYQASTEVAALITEAFAKENTVLGLSRTESTI